jgi:hypothetical protein
MDEILKRCVSFGWDWRAFLEVLVSLTEKYIVS